MDTLTFGSFPRSGNHFVCELLSKSVQPEKFVYLEHRINELAVSTNVFATIRTPMECVPSWITLTSDVRLNRAEKILEWYCAYYQKCKDAKVLIVPFSHLISEPLFCVNHVLNTFDFDLVESLDFDLSTGFHFPTQDKSGYQSIVDEMCSAKSFNMAMSLFEELCVPVG